MNDARPELSMTVLQRLRLSEILRRPIHETLPIVGLALIVTCGCSGKSSPPPPSAVQAPKPVAVAKPAGKAGQNAPRPLPSGPNSAPVRSRLPEIPPDVDTRNLFLAFAERPNFAVVPPDQAVNRDDQFIAARPLSGNDGSGFLTILPDWAEQTNRPSATFTLPEGFTAIESGGYTADGLPRRLQCEADSAEMVLVPAGLFVMGTDDGPEDTRPAHAVEIDAYYIDVTEVTLGQYERFLSENESNRRPARAANAGQPADLPALGIPWGDARGYAKWAKKSLPTEAEWEKAARGPDSFEHPWGGGRPAWERRREPFQIDPVGSFRADRSVYGVMDMAGNASEWVDDFYRSDTYREAAEEGSIVRNPTGPRRPEQANMKVVRGNGPGWKVWHRSSASMRSPGPQIGFRCVVRLPKVEEDEEATSPAATRTPR